MVNSVGSQTTNHTVLSNAGSNATIGNLTFSYTLGETFGTSLYAANADISLTTGFQQPQNVFGLISGNFRSIKGNNISNVLLKKNELLHQDLMATNRYELGAIYPLSNLTIKPTKNNDIKKNNGVSRIDVILVQNHILNKIKLNSPFKLIAADVNNNKSISNIDVIFMKRLILGIDTTFTGNRLWAFVDSAYKFADTTNPFPFKDSISFNNLTTNQTNQTFIGVKIGDVNYDWNPSLSRGNTIDNVELLYNVISTKEKSNQTDLSEVSHFVRNDELRIPISVKNFKELTALQYTLNFNHKNYEFVGIENNKLGVEFNDKQKAINGNISFLWADAKGEGHTLEDGNEIFTLVLKTKEVGISNDKLGLSLTNDITEIEAWDKNYQQHNIVLTKRETKGKQQEIKQITLSPNPAKDFLNVKLINTEAKQISIFNTLRKIVYTTNIVTTNNQIPVGNLTTGTYFVEIITADGNKQVEKFIKN